MTQTVELFGTLVRQTSRAYCFMAEDQPPAVWIAKSIATWDGTTMTMPRWLARKNRWIGPIPPDDDPVWPAAADFCPAFHATAIRKNA